MNFYRSGGYLMSNIKVSVIMPVYNDGENIEESLNSVYNQTLNEIEVVCINDGSTDNSLEIMNTFKEKFLSMQIINQENLGSGIARNRGMEVAQGEYLAFLDADDKYLDNNALELMYNIAIAHDADMVSANLKGILASGELENNPILKRFSKIDTISPKDYGIPYSYIKNIFKKSFIEENGFTFPDLRRGQDPVFLAEILTTVKEIPVVPVDLYGVRYPVQGSLNKINNHQKKHDYIMHFKSTFDVLRKANFIDMFHDYEVKLYEYIKHPGNSKDRFIYDTVNEIFKDDKEVLDKALPLFDIGDVKVSIVIPVYNASAFLDYSINSILNQTLKDIELVCVNDGSKDNSLEILKDFAQKDSRIHIIDQENGGCGAARNRGLDNVHGKYVYFFDPDDFLVPNALEELYNNAINNDSDLVLFKLAFWIEGQPIDYSQPYFDLDEYFIGVDFNNFTFNHNDIKRYVMNAKAFAPWFKLYRTDFLKAYDDFYFPVNLPFDDVPFHVKSLLRASRISFVPDFFYHYKIDNPNSVNSTSSNSIKIINIINIVEDFLRKDGFYEDFKKEFYTFKIYHTYIYFFRASDGEEFFQAVKKEYLRIKRDFFDQDESNRSLIEPFLLTIYDNVIRSNSFEEYKLRYSNYNLNIKVNNLTNQLAASQAKVNNLNNQIAEKNKLIGSLRNENQKLLADKPQSPDANKSFEEHNDSGLKDKINDYEVLINNLKKENEKLLIENAQLSEENKIILENVEKYELKKQILSENSNNASSKKRRGFSFRNLF